jgi:hypothetical protein
VLKGKRCLVKVMTSPTNGGQIDEFLSSYQHTLEEAVHKNEKYVLLFDARKVKMSLMFVAKLSSFFARMKDTSEKALIASSICMQDEKTAKTVHSLVQAGGGSVPSMVSHDIEACRNYLKNFAAVT